MTLRLPPTSACAAAARRPSPVPRARVRRCPARVARSRRRADRQGSPQGRRLGVGWQHAVRRRAWLLRGCLLCGGLTFTGLWLIIGAAQAVQAGAGAAAAQRRERSAARGSSWPALAAAAVQAGREPGFCCGPPAAIATARILGTHCCSGGLPPLSSRSRAAQPQQGQPQQGQPLQGQPLQGQAQQGHGSQQPCSRGLS